MNNDTQTLDLRFERIQKSKLDLMNMLYALPEATYLKQPNPQRWSAAQAANHLYLSERLSLAYLRKKLSYPDTIPKYHIKSWLAMFTYKFILGTIIKVKAPKPINMWEDQDILLPAQLDLKWNALRSEMLDFLHQHYPQFRNHLVFRHPFAGRLSMNQMLIFFNDHIRHHTRQVKKILIEVG